MRTRPAGSTTARTPGRLARIGIAVACATALAACGGDDDAAGEPTGEPTETASIEAAPDEITVDVVDFAFAPDAITVAPGGELVFSNLDEAAHTATADDGAFTTDTIDGGASVTLTAPDAPGSYAYYCAFHPFMTGELVVE